METNSVAREMTIDLKLTKMAQVSEIVFKGKRTGSRIECVPCGPSKRVLNVKLSAHLPVVVSTVRTRGTSCWVN